MNERKVETEGSLKSYVTGFLLSLLLTFVAYWLVVEQDISGGSLVAAILVLAVLQLLVQLVFFLHLGRESRPRWNLLAFLFAGLVVLIIVVGSIWIMNNLNYNMMSPQTTDKHIIEDEGIKPSR